MRHNSMNVLCGSLITTTLTVYWAYVKSEFILFMLDCKFTDNAWTIIEQFQSICYTIWRAKIQNSAGPLPLTPLHLNKTINHNTPTLHFLLPCDPSPAALSLRAFPVGSNGGALLDRFDPCLDPPTALCLWEPDPCRGFAGFKCMTPGPAGSDIRGLTPGRWTGCGCLLVWGGWECRLLRELWLLDLLRPWPPPVELWWVETLSEEGESSKRLSEASAALGVSSNWSSS